MARQQSQRVTTNCPMAAALGQARLRASEAKAGDTSPPALAARGARDDQGVGRLVAKPASHGPGGRLPLPGFEPGQRSEWRGTDVPPLGVPPQTLLRVRVGQGPLL